MALYEIGLHPGGEPGWKLVASMSGLGEIIVPGRASPEPARLIS
jgi:hypothetical protein